MKRYTLENEYLSVIIVPEMGGKSISVYEKGKQFELLAQPRPGYQEAYQKGTSFADCAAFGFDDAFPNIDGGSVLVDGKMIAYPDHGEIWSSPMEVISWDQERNTLELYYKSPLLQYGYEKKILLRDRTIVYAYRITNQGTAAFPFIWAFHCLVRYEEDMRILFPKDTNTFTNVLQSSVLGKAGTQYQVEQTKEGLTARNTNYRFDRVPEAKSRSMEKYYVSDAVKEGLCGYDYPSHEVRCRIRYDAAKLPWLGFFVTAGGFKGDYNCALEPSDGYYDSIETALHNKRCPVAEPGEHKEFEIEIEIA